MDFDLTPRQREVRDRVKAFMEEYIIPAIPEYEAEMNQLNRLQAPEVESVYLMASPQYSFLSSSGIKELAIFDGNIEELVTPLVARRLKEELAR